jgi:transketolase
VALVLAEIGVAMFAESGAVSRHPGRVVNVGIREQLMVSVAAGMALEGFRPIVHTYAPFLVERPFEQLKLDFPHQGVAGVFVSVGASVDAAAAGKSHQAPEDVAVVSSLPGLTVAIPGHPEETASLLRWAVAAEGSTYLRLSEQANDEAVGAGPIGIGVVRRGSAGAPTVLAVGPMLDTVREAVADLDATVLYSNVPHPLDGPALAEETSGTEVLVVEPYLEGTSAHAVSHALAARPHRLRCIGFPRTEHRRYGRPEEHLAAHGLDVAGVRRRISSFLSG